MLPAKKHRLPAMYKQKTRICIRFFSIRACLNRRFDYPPRACRDAELRDYQGLIASGA